jgi:signal transduction histidine kinase
MRLRLLLVLLGVVAVVLAVHDIPLARHLERVERDRLVTKLERDAFVLAGRAEESLESGTAADAPVLGAVVERYSAEEDVRVAIVDAAATGVVGSDEEVLQEDFSNRPEFTSALAGAPTTGERYSETLGEDLFFVAVPVLSGEEVVGAVRISAPERVVSDRAASRVRGLLVVALISLAIAVVAAWVFARSVIGPLARLRTTTDHLAAGDLDARADENTGPPEVRALAASFNSMANRLALLVERQRAFAGTTSHQLRTPLTALRLRLERLAEEVGDDPRLAESVGESLAETDRLRRMIEGLLALSRADDAAAAVVTADLAAVLRERAEYWKPLADERGVTIDVEVPAVATVSVVAGGLEQIVDNLVDNALEVSPEGSTVRLAAVPVGRVVELHVSDEGPGLSEPERDQAFERFWRGDDAAPGGSGLGLAIVQQLVAAGNGQAELRASPSGGLDAVVTLRTPSA